MNAPIEDPKQQAVSGLQEEPGVLINRQIGRIAELESHLAGAKATLADTLRAVEISGRLESPSAEIREALSRAKQEIRNLKVRDLGTVNDSVLLNVFRLTVFEATKGKVYLATEEAPAITHFVLERSQFAADADIRPGSVMMVEISATLVALPEPPIPSADEQVSLRQEMIGIAEELEEHSISGPVVL